MRTGEIVLIVALVAGMFLALALGIGKNSSDSIGDVAIATPSNGLDGGDPEVGAAANLDCSSGDCGACASCSGGEPILAVFVDFSQDGEYALTGATLRNTGNHLAVYDVAGNQIGSFNISGDGKMVPTATQPDHNVVKSAYSGPTGDTYTKYKIYPPGYDHDKNVAPLMAVDHNNGNVSVSFGDNLERKNAKSYLNTFGTASGSAGADQGGSRRGRRGPPGE